MDYQHVCIEGFAYTLPEEMLTTEKLEEELRPLYERLKLPFGRLELLTGIRERRLNPEGMLPGDQSVHTVERLLEITDFDRTQLGTLLHGSVCTDFAEPATACSVHKRLGLSVDCDVYDVSNACLGILTGMLQIANRIELGQIKAGIVVGTECSRSLMESTIEQLNTDLSITRQTVKPAFASLTIGSGSAAVLLSHSSISRTGNRLLGGVLGAYTEHCELCRSATDPLGRGGEGTLMETDAEELMYQGVRAASVTLEHFLRALKIERDAIDKIFSHQVGKKHRDLLFQTLQLDSDKNFTTLEYLGNTGSCALPTAAAIGTECAFVRPGEKIALLGIGSGINVLMLAIDWQKTLHAEPLECDAAVIERIKRINGIE